MSNNPFSALQSSDQLVNRAQREIEDDLRRRVTPDTLTRVRFSQDHSAKVSDRALVYEGTGYHRLVLPSAAEIGAGEQAIVYVSNRGAGPLFVLARQGETVSVGAIRVGRMAAFASDADSWKAVSRGEETLFSTTNAAFNVGVGETTLATYSLPGGTLCSDNDSLELDYTTSFQANANNKQVRIYFGATLVMDTGAVPQNGGVAVFHVKAYRISTTALSVWSTYISSGGALAAATVQRTAPVESLTAALVVKITGQGGAGNDIALRMSGGRLVPAVGS